MLFLLLIPLIASAGTVRKLDLNRDGQTDVVGMWEGQKLLEQKIDQNFDGTWDTQIAFPGTHFLKTVETSNKRKFYSEDLTRDLLIQETQIKTNGKWDKNYFLWTRLTQLKECLPLGLPAVEVPLVASQMAKDQSFFKTDFGYSIDPSCFEKTSKDWFLKNAKESLSQGLACLDRLGQQKLFGASINKDNLESLMGEGPVRVVCSEPVEFWRKMGPAVAARATTGEDRKGLIHPSLSFNPVHLDVEKADQFKRTFFHEQLHNLGYQHGVDPEVPYTCEVCCFPDGESKAQKDLACKLCGSSATEIADLGYVKDITRFLENSDDKRPAFLAALAYLQEHPGDPLGMSLLASNLTNTYNPVGVEFAKLLKGFPGLDSEAKGHVTDALTGFGERTYKDFEASAKTMAAVYFNMASGKQVEAAVMLGSQLPQIQQDLSGEVLGDKVYTQSELRHVTWDLVYDLYATCPPKSASHERACSQLLNFLKSKAK